MSIGNYYRTIKTQNVYRELLPNHFSSTILFEGKTCWNCACVAYNYHPAVCLTKKPKESPICRGDNYLGINARITKCWILVLSPARIVNHCLMHDPKIYTDYWRRTMLLVAGLIEGTPGLAAEFPSVHVLASGCSFYSQCLPKESLDFIFCFTSAHWLSKRSVNASCFLFCIHQSSFRRQRQTYYGI